MRIINPMLFFIGIVLLVFEFIAAINLIPGLIEVYQTIGLSRHLVVALGFTSIIFVPGPLFLYWSIGKNSLYSDSGKVEA